MPTQVSYPGVYIEEIPSGVRTITGVATSITAFMGRAPRGLIDTPVTINSYGDFERQFGGLNALYPMSYAVRDFFANGGGQAIILRLYKAPNANASGVAQLGSPLKLVASSPGAWGNGLAVEINPNKESPKEGRYGLPASELFNLEIRETVANKIVQRELLRNLTVKDSPRRIDRVLEAESSLARVAKKGDLPDLPASVPSGSGKASGGFDSAALTALEYEGAESKMTGLYALKKADLFNLLCIPPDDRNGDIDKQVVAIAAAFCATRRAMLIVDPPFSWGQNRDSAAANAKAGLNDFALSAEAARNAALYFPRVLQADPLRENQTDTFAPCGMIAGVMARTDVTRGVWKAPAGIDAALGGIRGLQVEINNEENGILNPLGINCLRAFPIMGRVVWGARTMRGADQVADEYKYIPVRRLALFIEESLYRGTQWVVFEPNDEPLWAQIRLNVGAFMHNLFRQGAFQGTSPRDAFFVKCDNETTTQNDINLGIVNIIVGFAPLKPAEFVIIKLQQIAGKIES